MPEFNVVLAYVSSGLVESGSPILQTSAYRKQNNHKQLPETTWISEVVTPSKLSCSLLCSENMECESFRFVVTTNVCQLHNKVPDAIGTSSKLDPLLYYVRSSVAENKGKAGQQALTAGTWNGKTRILFTPIATYGRISQLTHERKKSSCTTYKFISHVQGIALDYSPILIKIFLATELPNITISNVLDSMKSTSIRRGYYTGLAVDGRNKLLLCARDREIYSISADGGLLKGVPTTPSKYDNIMDVVVVSSAGIVFLVKCNSVTAACNIGRMDYFGKHMEIYVSNSPKRILSLAFDPSTHLLIYNLNNQVKQFNVTSHTHSDLTSIGDIVHIVVGQGIVYIMDGTTLKVFEGGENKTYINLPHSDYNYMFCVIH